MEYESAFLIHGTVQIIGKLKILFKKKCLLNVHYGYDNQTFITTIHDLNLVDDVLVFYHKPKESEVRELLHSDKVTFKADYLGIKIAFDSYRVDKYKLDGLSAFSIPIPNKLLWIEARYYNRIRTLDSLSGYCHLTVENKPEPVKFKLFDISIDGFSMLIDDPEMSILMAPDSCFEHCKISLEQTGEGFVSFKVRSKFLLNPDAPQRTEKVGCKFTQITPAFEDLIHGYMGKIEREYRQRQ
jgi:c-di-GMP-binding flagellar brake protein YcgR